MDEQLNDRAANHRPMVAIKVLLAIAMGVAGLALPVPELSVLVVAFALYCFADGVSSAVLASHLAVSGTRWAENTADERLAPDAWAGHLRYGTGRNGDP